MPCKIHALAKQEDGVAAIEFAFVLPVFLLFIMGILEIGYIMFGNALMDNALTNYSRAAMIGERYVGGTTTQPYPIGDINTYIARKTAGIIDPCSDNFKLTIAVEGAPGNSLGGPMERVEYTLTYDWPLISNYLSKMGIFDNIVHFRSTTLVRNEAFDEELSRAVGGC